MNILSSLAKRLTPTKPVVGAQDQSLRWTTGVVISIIDATHLGIQIDGNGVTITAATANSAAFSPGDVAEVLVGSNRLYVFGATAAGGGRWASLSPTGAVESAVASIWSTAFGDAATLSGPDTSGSATAVGSAALAANTTGVFNVAVGADALRVNTTGSQNTAVGTEALRPNTASANTAVGANALTTNTTGQQNASLGAYALSNNLTGNDNTAAGNNALQTMASGNGNTAVGSGADGGAAVNYGTALGYGTSVTADGAVAIGTDSAGTGAFANSADEMVLGTALHTVVIPGALMIPQYALAPPYIKGGMYFDTTASKLYIGGATAWEQVTSI